MIDKDTLIGSCVQLPRHFDVNRMRTEIASIPTDLWGEYRSEEQREAIAVFLRGFPPAQFRPDVDRPVLANLPYLRRIVHEEIPGLPRKCLVARLPAGGRIPLHVDTGAGMEEYFTGTLRFHIVVRTNPRVRFYVTPGFFAFGEGELWVINNRVEHGVLNDHIDEERVHLIVDTEPDADTLDLIRAGRRPTGTKDEATLRRLSATQPSQSAPPGAHGAGG